MTSFASQAARDFALTHLAFHRICRIEYERQSNIGLQWREHSLSDEAFSPGLANRIVQPYLEQSARFVLEGFPKRVDELGFLKDRYDVMHAVLFLDAPVELLLSRARSRLQYPDCLVSFVGMPTGLKSCPQCGARGERRVEDSETNFRKRYEDFREYGEGMLEGHRSFSLVARRVFSVHEAIGVLRSIERSPQE